MLSEDTYLGSIYDPLSLNLYTYCANNPIIYYDPDGESWLGIVVGVAVGVAVGAATKVSSGSSSSSGSNNGSSTGSIGGIVGGAIGGAIGGVAGGVVGGVVGGAIGGAIGGTTTAGSANSALLGVAGGAVGGAIGIAIGGVGGSSANTVLADAVGVTLGIIQRVSKSSDAILSPTEVQKPNTGILNETKVIASGSTSYQMKSDGTIVKTWGNGTADISSDHEAYNRILCEMIAAAVDARGSEDSLRIILAEINMTPQWNGSGQAITIHFQGAEVARLEYDKHTNSYISNFKGIYGSAFNSNLNEIIVHNDLGYAKVVKYAGGIWPVDMAGTWINSPYGYRDTGFHGGVDITGSGIGGKNAVASYRGTVVFAGWSGDYGNLVQIESLIDGEKTIIYYAHLNSIDVSKDDYVEVGDTVGKVGSTGKSTGDHLHFEVRPKDIRTNPSPYIKQ